MAVGPSRLGAASSGATTVEAVTTAGWSAPPVRTGDGATWSPGNGADPSITPTLTASASPTTPTYRGALRRRWPPHPGRRRPSRRSRRGCGERRRRRPRRGQCGGRTPPEVGRVTTSTTRDCSRKPTGTRPTGTTTDMSTRSGSTIGLGCTLSAARSEPDRRRARGVLTDDRAALRCRDRRDAVVRGHRHDLGGRHRRSVPRQARRATRRAAHRSGRRSSPRPGL